MSNFSNNTFFQDWEPVSWDKRTKKQGETKKQYIERQVKSGSGTVSTVVNNKNVNKVKNTMSNDKLLNKKIEDQSEDFRVKRISMNIAKNIAKKRVELKMTQKELALKLALPETVIRDYENLDNKTTYNSTILNKIERVLGRVRE